MPDENNATRGKTPCPEHALHRTASFRGPHLRPQSPVHPATRTQNRGDPDVRRDRRWAGGRRRAQGAIRLSNCRHRTGRLCQGDREKIRGKVDVLAETISREQGKILSLARGEGARHGRADGVHGRWRRRIEASHRQRPRARRSTSIGCRSRGRRHPALELSFLSDRTQARPALVAGNTIVIKPSEETPLNAFLFAELAA
ncbi:aldehyde dehydrogenase family protein [Sinorhizobium meliloti]|nr:aldehyde dehydrogenase family protein [Sinorhizobium meliloti]